MLGYKATTQDGFEGVITKEFENFQSISFNYINDKNDWLSKQEKPFTSENLEEKWYVLWLDLGGSCLSPFSRLSNVNQNVTVPNER